MIMTEARKKILVIDDKPYAAQVITFFYRKTYRVDHLVDPVRALRVLANEHYDLIILDYKMPEMNGYQFLVEFRKTSDLPVILCSSSDPIRSEFRAAGITDFLDKPFRMEDLDRLVENIFQESGR